MKFCLNLCNDINFEPDAVQPCCNVHAIAVPRFPFTGGRLDMAAYARHIQNVVEQLQKGGAVCRGCPECIEINAPQDSAARLPFRSVSINMHRHLCNCRCVYCDLWRGHGAGYAILPVLRNLEEQKVLRRDCFFSWGGGEPGILPDFEEASQWILHNGWPQYVHTNALRFSPAIAALLREGKGGVNVSLDSASPEVYRAVKGVDGFTRVTANIERYRAAAREAGLIHLKYIIFEKNNAVAELERFFALCRALDVTSVQFSLNFQELNGAGPAPKTLLGAAFFRHRAASLGMACVPFFIPKRWLSVIDELEQRHFSGAVGRSLP